MVLLLVVNICTNILFLYWVILTNDMFFVT